MKIIQVCFLVAAALAATARPVWADDAAILARLAALEEEIRVLKRQLEAKKEDEDKKKAEPPVVTASAKDGFSIQSPDGHFKLRLRGLLQTDGRFFTDNRKDLGTTDTITMRRLRAIFEGTLYNQFDFNFTPSVDGGTASVQDAYIDYRYAPELRLRAGRFKVPFAIERIQSSAATSFVELGLPQTLAPNYDVGAQVHGDVWLGAVSYAAGVFNGTTDGGSADTDLNNDKEFVGRLFVTPLKNSDLEPLRGLSGGLAATYGHKEGAALPTVRSLGQAPIFSYLSGVSADGEHARFSPQLTYYFGPLGMLGEYISSDQTVVRTSAGSIIRQQAENEAWQVIVSYVLTGEDASFKGVTPRKNFSPQDGSWGAFELAGRVNRLDIDNLLFERGFANATTSVSEAEAWGLGLNWYLNRNLKVVFDFEHTEFEGGALDAGVVADRPDENVIFTRLQLSY